MHFDKPYVMQQHKGHKKTVNVFKGGRAKRRWQWSLAQNWKAVVESESGTSRGITFSLWLWIPQSIQDGIRYMHAFLRAYRF